MVFWVILQSRPAGGQLETDGASHIKAVLNVRVDAPKHHHAHARGQGYLKLLGMQWQAKPLCARATYWELSQACVRRLKGTMGNLCSRLRIKLFE